MRILITGGKGMLGRTLQRVLADEHELVIADLPEWDVTDAEGFARRCADVAPEVVIHCAAMTAVDACESAPERAFRLNADGSEAVARACAATGARLIAMSTDYVFGGGLDRPYHEGDAAGDARTIYGRSKFAGEERIRHFCPRHLICRISWLYGEGGPSFVHSMLKLADGTRAALKVVNDQHGNPTSALAVARRLKDILLRPEICGTLHLTCEGEATWYEFAQEIFRLCGIGQGVVPCTTDEFPRPAPRPLNSRLEKRALRKWGLPAMPDWREALKDYLRTENLLP